MPCRNIILVPLSSLLLGESSGLSQSRTCLLNTRCRELATQIYNVLIELLAFHAPSAAHLNTQETSNPQPETITRHATDISQQASLAPKVMPQLLLGGGQTPQADIAQFLQKSPNVIIATPGRLVELLSSPYVHTPQSSFQVLVMDEADRLLDMGFQETLQKILQRLPKQRRTGLFSASINDAVERLVKIGIQNPYRINVKVRGAEGKEDVRTPARYDTSFLAICALSTADKTTQPLITLPHHPSTPQTPHPPPPPHQPLSSTPPNYCLPPYLRSSRLPPSPTTLYPTRHALHPPRLPPPWPPHAISPSPQPPKVHRYLIPLPPPHNRSRLPRPRHPSSRPDSPIRSPHFTQQLSAPRRSSRPRRSTRPIRPIPPPRPRKRRISRLPVHSQNTRDASPRLTPEE